MRFGHLLVIALALTLLAVGAQAGTYSYTGTTPVAIPDDGSGSLPASLSITVPDSYPVASVAVSLTLTHSSVGDLIATLTKAGATPVTVYLFRLVGSTATPPESFPGDDDNLNGTYVFADSAAAGLRSVVQLEIGDDHDVPVGTYRATDNTFTGTEPPVSLNSAFGGMDVGGTWTLAIKDPFDDYTGQVTAFSLEITALPEPGLALTALATGGLLAVRRRRSSEILP